MQQINVISSYQKEQSKRLAAPKIVSGEQTVYAGTRPNRFRLRNLSITAG